MLAHTLQEMRGPSHEPNGVEACAQSGSLCAALDAQAEPPHASGAMRCVAACPESPTLFAPA